MDHVGTQTIETERLSLRKYEITDAEDMFRNWVTDAEAIKFWTWKPHKDIDETKAILRCWIDDYLKPDTYHWVIVLKSISQAIGYIYLDEINDADESISIHYLLSRKYWNQGIMTEACRGSFGLCFFHIKREKGSYEASYRQSCQRQGVGKMRYAMRRDSI